VVVLQEVLADELVVRREFVGLLPYHLPLVEPVVREALWQVAVVKILRAASMKKPLL
jgi:hypothetical protein